MGDEVQVSTDTSSVSGVAEAEVADTTVVAEQSATNGRQEEQAQEKPHALDVGGERFNQVWARAKAAEGKLQAEREERIRLEERLKAQQDVAQVKAEATKPAEHSWETLESWIAEGKLSRAQAMAYREGIIEERSIAKATAKLDAQLKETQRTTTVTGELERYKQALPAITQPGTPERVKVETQYSYLINTLGHQPGLATELLASKLAFGDAEILEKQRTTQRATADQHEVMMETHSTTRPAETTAKDKHDPVAKLDARQREHYERMIKAGRYNDWGEVRKELAWERKR